MVHPPCYISQFFLVTKITSICFCFFQSDIIKMTSECVYLNHAALTPALLFSTVPSEPPQNVRAISVTSDEAVITWAEPPRLTLHGVLKGYRVVFWSLFPDGGGCCGGQAQWPMQSNYHLSHSKRHQPNPRPPAYVSVGVVSQNVSVCVLSCLIKHFLCPCLPLFVCVFCDF